MSLSPTPAHTRLSREAQARLIEKYDGLAEGFSEREYAEPVAYAARCARVICACSPRLGPGADVLDLACGDGLMAASLVARGLRYRGVDASTRMVNAARARHPGLTFVVARIEEFEPPEPVETTICLRGFYYPDDQVAFFRHVAGTRGAPSSSTSASPSFPITG